MKMFNQLFQSKPFIMSTFTQVCGLDISKDNLDYYLANKVDEKRIAEAQLVNQGQQISELFSAAQFDNTLFVLEFTGSYGSKAIHELTKLKRPISLVSPLQSKSFMSVLGQSNKTDKLAAYALSAMGCKLSLRLYKAPSQEMQNRKQILTTLQALEKQERMLCNQLHAMDQLAIIEQHSYQALQIVLDSVRAQIHPLRQQLYLAAQDENFNQKKKYATSVKGIGEKTAEALLLVTNGLEDFDSPDKLSKFLGLTPSSHHSGSSIRRRGGITKFGSNQVRSLLYMCTKSAIRYNKPCKELYLRLRHNGKPHKVAAVAVMHKLVKQVFACVNNKTLFDNEYHLYSKKN